MFFILVEVVQDVVLGVHKEHGVGCVPSDMKRIAL